jgi:predicted transcriptional regulator
MKKKTIISLQLPEEIIKQLKDKAEAECTSVSYLIRRAILRELNDKEN